MRRIQSTSPKMSKHSTALTHKPRTTVSRQFSISKILLSQSRIVVLCSLQKFRQCLNLSLCIHSCIVQVKLEKLVRHRQCNVLKCLLECKLKNPLYYVLSPQGIVGSEIQGLLPSKSPSIFNIALQLLDIPENLTQVEKSLVSKEGYAIVRGIRDGDSVLSSLAIYGWKDVKKQKENPKDSQYWTYKARRKQQGGLNDEYGLAWNPKHGLCRMKYVDLTKDSYETEFYKNYAEKVSYFQENQNKKINLIEIHKCVKEGNGIKVFTSIPNQGSLSDYISKKHMMGKSLTQKNFLGQMDAFIEMMKAINQDGKVNGFGTLHIRNLFVHNNKIILGEPTLITDKVEKKMRQLKNSLDYYAPEMKQNIILPENLFKLDFEKMDIWFLGFMLHKIYTREVPLFDPAKKPIINKQKFSPGIYDLICRCLNLAPNLRPVWKQINLRELQKFNVEIEQVEQVKQERVEIKLGNKNEQKMRQSSNKFSRKMQEEDLEYDQPLSPSKIKKDQIDVKSIVKQQQEDLPPPLPMELSSRLKKVKLVTKIVIIMCMYIFVYFLPFLGNSIDIILVRSFYGTASLHLVDHSGNRLSSTTVITHNPNFFLLNDISFIDIQNTYRCIPNNFNSSDDPSYSLLTYIHSTGFLALLLTGWLMVIVICVTKAISIWKGGVGNRPSKNLCKYWAVYTFFQLCMATLLFAHFYIYHFFYFAGASPCLSYANFSGLDPYFDSSLYLMLSDQNGYLQQVFSTLGILSIFVLCSACFYAWGPKLDNKYILSVMSIILRFIPFLLFLLICRVGVFSLFGATGINDSTGLLPAVITGSFYGFIGIIPEVFVVACVGVEILLELFFYWCEAKAAENDKMAKFFNIRKRKVTNLDDNDAGLNDMSLVDNSKFDNSKHHLEMSDD